MVQLKDNQKERMETVYRFRYSGNQIKSIHTREEVVKNENWLNGNCHWFVIVVGALACVGWWKIWV